MPLATYKFCLGMCMFFRLLIVTITLTLQGCGDPSNLETTAEKRSTMLISVPVELATTIPMKHFYSRITGSDVVYVASLSQGRIESLYAYSGQLVKKGDVLGSLYSPRLSAQLREKQALLASSKRTEQKTQLDFDRAKKLFTEKLIANSALESARLAFNIATQQVQAAQAQVEEAKNALNENKIFARKEGIVTNIYARSGDVVSAGQPIFQLQTLSTLKTEFQLPEQEFIALQLNQTVRVAIPSLSKSLSGKIIEKGLPSNAVGKLFKLIVDLEVSDSELVGLHSRLELPITNTPLYKVPSNTIHYDALGQAYVLVTEPKVHRRDVTIFDNDDNQVIVTAPKLMGKNVLITSEAKLNFNLALLEGESHEQK